VEALLAAAASPVPPPLDDLVPDPLLRDELPEDLHWLPRLLPRADLYLQDEVEIALHPTLTRVWCPRAVADSAWSKRRGTTKSSTAPGWSTGATAGSIGIGRTADALRRCVLSCAALSRVPRRVGVLPWCS
jgi:hypothetical protein